MVEFTQTVEADLAAMNADQLLDHLINVRSAMAKLKATDEALLDRLDALVAEGQIDPGGFSHNDWSFSYSAGRKSWTYPAGVKALDSQLKAAKRASEADGSAISTLGAPFWTIRSPQP